MAEQDKPSIDPVQAHLMEMAMGGASQEDLDNYVYGLNDAGHPFKAFASGLTEDAINNFVPALASPFIAAKNDIEDLIDMATGKQFTDTHISHFVDTIEGLPEAWNNATPRERGRMVGSLLANAIGGGLTMKAMTAGKTLRGAGRALEYTGSRKSAVPFAVGSLGASGVGASIATGNPEYALGGLVSAGIGALAPRALVRVGQKLQKWGGGMNMEEEGLNEEFKDAMANRNLSAAGEREAARVAAEKEMRGEIKTATKEVDAKQAADAAAKKTADTSQSQFATDVNREMEKNVGDVIRVGTRQQQGQLSDLNKAIAERRNEAAGTRAASQRAEDLARRAEDKADLENVRTQQRADANAERLRRIEEERAGYTENQPSFRRSESAKDAQGRTVSSSRSFSPPEPEETEAADPLKAAVDKLMTQNPGMPEAMARKVVEASSKGVSDLTQGRPPIRVGGRAAEDLAAGKTAEPAAATATGPASHPAREPVRVGAEPAAAPTKSATDWASEMAELRKTKPSSIEKYFGKNGPPSEEALNEYKQKVAEWNKKYRYASDQQKKQLVLDNEAFAKRQATEGAAPSTPSKSTGAKVANGWTPRDFDAYDQTMRSHPDWTREQVLAEVDRQRSARSAAYRSGELKKED